MKHSLQLTVEKLFESGTMEQLMDMSLSRMASFESACSVNCDSSDYNIRNTLRSKERYDLRKGQEKPPHAASRFTRSRVCHRTSSIGIMLGSIWVRISTLSVEVGSTASGERFEIITSFIFYPASWLTKVGFHYGAEASLTNSTSGWKFNFNPVRAVPENSLLFEFCRTGNVRAVELLLERGQASLRDTSPKGWTPLHVSMIEYWPSKNYSAY